MTKKIAVISGKRGGFGAMIPLIKAIEESVELELSLIVTDQHLSDKFGSTITEVEKWFKVSHKVDMEQTDDSPLARTKAIALCMSKMADVFERDRPDIILILGDRGEVFAAASAAINLGIPIAHIQGGDISGCVDEFIRHALTKMSHLHFPSTETSAKRILNMGEEPWRVHVTGDNHIDLMAQKKYTPAAELAEKFKLDLNKPVVLALQHSVTTEPHLAYDHMRELCAALKHYKYRTVLVYPCSDHGYEGITRAIEELRGEKWVSIHKNIDAPDFWGLEALASVFVGNSSAGLIETPIHHLPSITIGNRQIGRQRAENCLSVEPVKGDIIAAIDKCLNDKDFKKVVENCSQPFGDGHANERIFKVLKDFEPGPKLFEKKMTY